MVKKILALFRHCLLLMPTGSITPHTVHDLPIILLQIVILPVQKYVRVWRVPIAVTSGLFHPFLSCRRPSLPHHQHPASYASESSFHCYLFKLTQFIAHCWNIYWLNKLLPHVPLSLLKTSCTSQILRARDLFLTRHFSRYFACRDRVVVAVAPNWKAMVLCRFDVWPLPLDSVPVTACVSSNAKRVRRTSYIYIPMYILICISYRKTSSVQYTPSHIKIWPFWILPCLVACSRRQLVFLSGRPQKSIRFECVFGECKPWSTG